MHGILGCVVIEFVWVDDVELGQQAPDDDLVEIGIKNNVLHRGLNYCD